MAKNTVDGSGVRLPWAGKSVRIENVEEELSFLWKMSADNMRTGANINVRTSVLNFVICAPDIETAQHASKLLRDLASTHLARVTLLILDSSSNAAASVSTWITLRCFSIYSDLMRHCFEQTTVLTTGSAVRSAASIISPLLKPDLPVYLWWIGDPPDDTALFSSLVELSNRVIVDSTSFFHPEQDIRTLAELLQVVPNCALSDLNWGRLTPWRQLVAQFFDVPEYRPYLAGVSSIEIEHAAAPLAAPMRTEEGDVSPNPTRTLLLAGWLKERLGWTLPPDAQCYHDTASGTHQWHLERPTVSYPPTRGKTGRLGSVRDGSISIRPKVESDLRPGSICLVRLVSILENKQATFTISREKDLETVLTSVELSQETRPQRTVSLASIHNESELLHDELEITGHDYPFEHTLQELAELLG